jgi:ribonuclease BN (tRNA processing enzyme)
MKIKVLGCYGNVVHDYRATSFLINDRLLLDAGTVTEVLNDDELKGIKDVVVTHTHIDHIKGLFPLADELALLGKYGMNLVSVARVIEIMSKNLFNNLIWPDFTVIPSENNALINPRIIDIEKVAVVGGFSVKPVLVTHTVYSVGFVVKDGDKGFMFTADTGPTTRFWEIAREEKGIEFIMADVSFPSRLEKLAKISGHMTLSILVEHLDRYGLGNMPVFITHIKPIFLKEIQAELSALQRTNIRQLEQGAVITL